MPIRFNCQRCRQLLGIASRKAGSEIACPKCGLSQVVPSEEAAAAALAMNQFAKARQGVEHAADLVVYDDQPSVIETAGLHATEPHPSPSEPGQPAPGAPDGAVRPTPKDMILFSRQSMYVQGGLFLVLALLAFWTGYVMGLGDGKEQRRVEEIEQQRVYVRGTVLYSPDGTNFAGDENAVIVALPEEKTPKEKIDHKGIGPGDPPRESHASIRAIREELGGAYKRAGAMGNFDMVLPNEGRYYLLIISSNAKRPEGAEIDELALSQMEDYFKRPERLIGRSGYRWTLENVDSGFRRIEPKFGGGEPP